MEAVGAEDAVADVGAGDVVELLVALLPSVSLCVVDA